MSIPNHLFTQSATSCGVAENVLYSQCGGANTTFPQMTIYDSLNLVNESFGFYVNTTVPHGCDSYPKACDHGGWSELGDANYPDVIMDGVARHQDRFFSYSTFFAQAANGTLPSFSWIAPNQSYCDHPCQDVAKGERLTKDIYEALRAGPGWEKTLLAVLYDDAGGIYDHIVPPFAQTDDAPCNVGNRPGPGPPPSPAAAFDTPLRAGRHVGLGYEHDARLLTEAERKQGMAGRAPPMPEVVGNGKDGSGKTQTDHNATSLPPRGDGLLVFEPPELDGQQWTLLNTYHGMNTFVGFSYRHAPPGFAEGGRCGPTTANCGAAWMRVGYNKSSDALNFEFHEVASMRGPAGRVYKLRNHWPAGAPTYTGWLTWAPDPKQNTVQWYHTNGSAEEAALVRVEGTQTAGEYVLLNLGKDGARTPASSTAYISFANNGSWVRCNGYDLAAAMTVKLLKAGSVAPTPTPAPPGPPRRRTSCRKKFDFRRLGMRTVGMLMSPYIPAGTVFQEPRGPYPDSQFDLSSMSTTIKHLFGIPGYLTQRDAWAGSFHELLTLQAPRKDTPMHLPDAPPPHEERRRRLQRQSLLRDEANAEAAAAGRAPLHCSATSAAAAAAGAGAPSGECAVDGNAVTRKQRNQIEVFAAMTHVAPPSERELSSMSKEEAGLWIHTRWAEHMHHGLGWRREQGQQ